jgi:hypothetical protein
MLIPAVYEYCTPDNVRRPVVPLLGERVVMGLSGWVNQFRETADLLAI